MGVESEELCLLVLHRMSKAIAALAIVVSLALVAVGAKPVRADKGLFPMVVVAADGTGDFGPQTSGTSTSGIQEAINYCVANQRDLYIKGGATYNVSSTIMVPATQDFRIDGGAYTLNWTGSANQDMLDIDSTMDGHYTFASLVYSGSAAALRFHPVNPVPIDGFAVLTDSEIKAGSIRAGASTSGTGVVYDNSNAGIARIDCTFNNISGFATGISMPSGASGFNRVKVLDLHTGVPNATLMVLGGSQNTVDITIGVDNNASGVRGLDILGPGNKCTVTTAGGFAPQSDIVFESAAQQNQVAVSAGGSVSAPSSIITDLASNPSNQITWTGSPIPASSLVASAGVYTYTQRLYPATVRVVAGNVSDIKLLRGGTAVDYGLQRIDILMGAGDRLQVTSSGSPGPTLQIAPQANG